MQQQQCSPLLGGHLGLPRSLHRDPRGGQGAGHLSSQVVPADARVGDCRGGQGLRRTIKFTNLQKAEENISLNEKISYFFTLFYIFVILTTLSFLLPGHSCKGGSMDRGSTLPGFQKDKILWSRKIQDPSERVS